MVKDRTPLKMTSHRLANFGDKKNLRKVPLRPDNRLGAPVRVLPAKSLICIAGVNSSSVTLNDPVSVVSLILLFIGIGATLTFWFSGAVVTPLFRP